MNPVEDLHPDDPATRDMLRLALIGARLAEKPRLSQNALSRRIGCRQSALCEAEHHTTWTIPLLQRWARALNYEIRFALLGAPPIPPGPLDTVTPTDPAAADAWARDRLVEHIAEARRILGIRQSDVAKRVGCCDGVIGTWENGGGNTRLATAQRNARAIGVCVVATLHPAPAVAA